jgi:hypothetical protein
MPKTYTDDIGAALPAAVFGPFQVVDPNDATSFFKIDPAGARIQAAGAARSKRRLYVMNVRTSGVAALATIGTAIDARSIGPSLDGGFYTSLFRIPPEMDLSDVSNVIIPLAPAADGGSGTAVRFELTTTWLKDGDTSAANEVLTYDWPVPSGWTTEDLKLVTIDGGGGRTFAANKFEAGDVVGFLLRRISSATEDTYPNALLIGTALIFEYAIKNL